MTTLIAIVVVLFVIFLIKSGILTNTIILNNKELIDFIFRLITTCLVIIGGVMTFLKFFRGHLFLSRIKTDINVIVISIDKSTNLHFVEIEIENIGDFTIYNPDIELIYSIITVDCNLNKKETIETTLYEKNDMSDYNRVIRIKNKLTLPYQVNISNKIPAIKYELTLRKGNRIWRKMKIVKNVE